MKNIRLLRVDLEARQWLTILFGTTLISFGLVVAVPLVISFLEVISDLINSGLELVRENLGYKVIMGISLFNFLFHLIILVKVCAVEHYNKEKDIVLLHSVWFISPLLYIGAYKWLGADSLVVFTGIALQLLLSTLFLLLNIAGAISHLRRLVLCFGFRVQFVF